MSPIYQALLAVLAVGISVNGQTIIRLTATNSLQTLHIDGIQITPFQNGGNWQEIDEFPVSDDHSRLVAIRANNVIGGCSGLMVAISGHPTGYTYVSDRTWKCTDVAPVGWQFLGFDDSSWPNATEVAFNGQIVPGCPWVPLNTMPQSAFWIWTQNHMEDQVISCRGKTPICEAMPCLNGGTCQDNAADLCRCPVRHAGRFCEIIINECESNPCRNGGVCNLDEEGYICDCGVGFTGTHCETDTTDCASEPCKNGGTCIFDLPGGYSCVCPSGFTGADCQVDIDECESMPCQNGATCLDRVNGFVCVCNPGWTGAICHIDIDECASAPCQHLGSCHDLVNGYTCECYPGYTGVHCETAVDKCAPNPCQNGGTCTLTGPDGEVLCICDPAWTGQLCNIKENYCEDEPCKNGGTCIDLVGEFECECGEVYAGETCEEIAPHCGSIMAKSVYPPARNFWVLCEINIIDHPTATNTPCRDLITDINYYNNSQTILALGGTFGCFATKFPNEMADSSCLDDYNQDARLAPCLSCTHMGICLKVPPPMKKQSRK